MIVCDLQPAMMIQGGLLAPPVAAAGWTPAGRGAVFVGRPE